LFTQRLQEKLVDIFPQTEHLNALGGLGGLSVSTELASGTLPVKIVEGVVPWPVTKSLLPMS